MFILKDKWRSHAYALTYIYINKILCNIFSNCFYKYFENKSYIHRKKLFTLCSITYQKIIKLLFVIKLFTYFIFELLKVF